MTTQSVPKSAPVPRVQVAQTGGGSLLDATAPRPFRHRELLEGEFWRHIPAYADVDTETFLDYKWQGRHAITNARRLLQALEGLAPPAFIKDATEGFRGAPMSVRVSPYLMSLIDWNNPYEDPLRVQFIPLASRRLPDHPELVLDALAEQRDSPVPGLTHRYPDKALFLALDTCPVYCRFCTRSYAVGQDTEMVDKVHLHASTARWDRVFEYIEQTPQVEDIVVSGGDIYNLPAKHLRKLGHRLLDIPHIRRIRIASKGPAVLPQKLLTDNEWVGALLEVCARAQSDRKDFALHTHFNHASEITWITREAIGRLTEKGVVIRNQSVLQRGVNDSVEAMTLLVKRLSWINVHPYYVYVCDLVQGVEDMRTTLHVANELEKQVRGVTAGFNTPTFVVDTLGGGGKRSVHSYEYYDRISGIAVFRSPAVDPDRLYYNYDPVCQLWPEVQAKWADPVARERMKFDAATRARSALAGRS